MSKRRSSAGDVFKCPIQHVAADDVRSFFTIKENNRRCTLCSSSFKIGTTDTKTTSSLRTHLKTKHLNEVLVKHPKQEAEPKAKMSKLFDPFSVLATQEKYDKACLLRFIANGDTYSSLVNKGYLHFFLFTHFFLLLLNTYHNSFILITDFLT